ncbi:MAG: class I tRNA ligase family protein, partial [Spirochaetota bacterium]|nr:class I tRNA ligase family protein [Spirochaetota bacterium]
MAIKYYNTMSRTKEEFKPLKDKDVYIYTCGPTVYNYVHIGNLRTFLFEDILVRHLKFKGYEVHQVMNLTDVDDKTIKNSIQQGMSLSDYTRQYKDAFFQDINTLNISPAKQYPAATEHIDEMVSIIKSLEA